MLFQLDQSIGNFIDKMTTEDESSIIISPNYAGAQKRYWFTNEDLLKLTSEEGNLISGPSLFTLKYRILPCTVTEKK